VGSAQWQGAVFIDGEFRKPAGGGTIGVRDKASGEIFATAGLASEADVDRAVAAAKVAQPAWAMRTYAERATLLRDVAAVLGDRAKAMRELIMRETGCIGGKADYEISAAASELIEAAGLASRATGEVLPTEPRRAVLAVRADPSRPGRRDHPVELPAGPRHAGDRARDRARQRGADQAVPGDPRSPAGWRSPSCSRRPGSRPASSVCCPATSRSASGWSPTRTSR
jgi:hypothetical protein